MYPRTTPFILVLFAVGCGVEDRDPCAEIKAKLAACQVESSIPDGAQCSPGVLAGHEAIVASDCAALQQGKADWWAWDGCEAGTVQCYGLFCCSVPQLMDGDLVFQQSSTAQSTAIRILTHSNWTHVGVVRMLSKGPMVLEASSKVQLTSFDSFAARGKIAVKRLRDVETVSEAARKKMQQLGQAYLGRPYDVYFRWDDARLYCSELVFKLFQKAAGIEIGRVQKFSDFDLSNPEVQALIKKRYGNSPVPMDEPVVSPASMYSDPKLRTVF
jgi:hypothetical protein